MKLATVKSAGRDGALIVVSRDLAHGVEVPHIAPTLQAALEQWEQKSPALEEIYRKLNAGEPPADESGEVFAFDTASLESPLPRAYQWADGSAYVNHVELVRKARGAVLPESFWSNPLMYQGGSDSFIGPRDDILVESEDYGIDFESEIAVILDDVPMAVTPEAAGSHIRLLMLVNNVSLRNMIPAELAKGFGFFHAKPSTAFSPVAVTPDELGDAWDGGKVKLPLVTHLNGELFGRPDAGTDMTFTFPQLIAHAAKTRRLTAGSIVGSGTVSNLDRSAGSSCLAEKRMLEVIEDGAASTPFMRFGDRVRIEMLNNDGHSIFGAIDQQVVAYKPKT